MPVSRKGRGKGPPGRCPSRHVERHSGLEQQPRASDVEAKEGSPGSSDDGSVSSSVDEFEQDEEQPRISAKLCMFEFGQNDPKMDSGSRLVRCGLASSMKPDANFHGIVLSTQTEVLVSAADRKVIETVGLAGVNCSWNRIGEVNWDKLRRRGQHRTLPFLIAANTVNYGHPWKLNTAEALAAALVIVGMDADAVSTLRPFAWGKEFFRLNAEALQGYAAAKTCQGVRAYQDAYLARCEAEAVARKAEAVDFPPSSSSDEDEEEGNLTGRAASQPSAPPVEGEDKDLIVHAASRSSAPPVARATTTEASPALPADPQEVPAASLQAVAEVLQAVVQVEDVKPKSTGSPVLGVPCPRSIASQHGQRERAKEESEEKALSSSAGIAAEPAGEQESFGKCKDCGSSSPAELELPEEAPMPREQKAALLAIQAVAPVDFLADVGIAGLSGNALTRLRRSDFEAIWLRFRTAVAPGLREEQRAQVLGVSASVAARKLIGGKGQRRR